MSESLKLGFAQINPTVGAVGDNTEHIIKILEKQDNCDLVVFPELSLIGYPPMDLLHHSEVIKAQKNALENIREYTEEDSNPSVVVGCALENDNDVLENLAVLLDNGDVKCKYAKQLLPTYDIFDEHRYFESGSKTHVAKVNGLQVGLSVCEDAWHDVEVAGRKQHTENPMAEFENKNVDLVVNLSASPFKVGKPSARHTRFQKHASRADAPILFVNQVGVNDEIAFDGSSFVATSEGTIECLESFEEDFGLIEIPDATNNVIEVSHMGKTNQIQSAIELGISDYFKKTGFSEAIIGMSGGIDSSVTAVLASNALGAENIYGVMLSSIVTSDESVEDAKSVAENLGIKFRVINIESVVGSLNAILESAEEMYGATAYENIQARVRGVVLMGLANSRDALVLTPDNKSESGVGYCTLYGDTVGAVAPLGDVYKKNVYDMARRFNALANGENEFIPKRVISKAPSAELREEQEDADDVPPYDVIDSVLKDYVENTETVEALKNTYPNDMVDTITKRLRNSEFKRKQTPMPIRVTKKSFCRGWKYPVAADYDLIQPDN